MKQIFLTILICVAGRVEVLIYLSNEFGVCAIEQKSTHRSINSRPGPYEACLIKSRIFISHMETANAPHIKKISASLSGPGVRRNHHLAYYPRGLENKLTLSLWAKMLPSSYVRVFTQVIVLACTPHSRNSTKDAGESTQASLAAS